MSVKVSRYVETTTFGTVARPAWFTKGTTLWRWDCDRCGNAWFPYESEQAATSRAAKHLGGHECLDGLTMADR